jgi:hypothetical protein
MKINDLVLRAGDSIARFLVVPFFGWRRRSRQQTRLLVVWALILWYIVFNLGDIIFPIIGTIYLPPRSKQPPKLPYGLSLVASRPADHPAAIESVPSL